MLTGYDTKCKMHVEKSRNIIFSSGYAIGVGSGMVRQANSTYPREARDTPKPATPHPVVHQIVAPGAMSGWTDPKSLARACKPQACRPPD